MSRVCVWVWQVCGGLQAAKNMLCGYKLAVEQEFHKWPKIPPGALVGEAREHGTVGGRHALVDPHVVGKFPAKRLYRVLGAVDGNGVDIFVQS